MKKALMGVTTAAVALSFAAAPVLAGDDPYDGPFWDIDIYSFLTRAEFIPTDTALGAFDFFTDLVDVAGYDTQFDAPDSETIGDICANGDAEYTVFAPLDPNPWTLDWVDMLESTLGQSWAQILATPGVAATIVDDHVVNGRIADAVLENPSTQVVEARSGYKISITSPASLRIVGGAASNVSADGVLIAQGVSLCNGWIYTMGALFSTSPKEITDGLGPQDSPDDGTPGGTNTLPNTL